MAAKTSIINVQGTDISIISIKAEDYICLTDMIRDQDGEDHIRNWMRNKNTIEYLGIWERINNPNFKGVEFDTLLEQAGLNRFNLTPRKWIDSTNAIGIISKAGRYGGTYAHKDIAYNFGMWLSPEFYLLVVKEFQRLKEEENKYLKSPEWLHRRFLVKTNYTLQTDAVKQFIIPHTTLPIEKHGIIYANEAELVNFAVLGYTAKKWNTNNPQLVLKGENLRDNLGVIELIVLDNMQTLNSHLIGQDIPQSNRLEIIKVEARRQIQSLSKSGTLQNMDKKVLSPFDQSLKQALDYNPKEQK